MTTPKEPAYSPAIADDDLNIRRGVQPNDIVEMTIRDPVHRNLMEITIRGPVRRDDQTGKLQVKGLSITTPDGEMTPNFRDTGRIVGHDYPVITDLVDYTKTFRNRVKTAFTNLIDMIPQTSPEYQDIKWMCGFYQKRFNRIEALCHIRTVPMFSDIALDEPLPQCHMYEEQHSITEWAQEWSDLMINHRGMVWHIMNAHPHSSDNTVSTKDIHRALRHLDWMDRDVYSQGMAVVSYLTDIFPDDVENRK